MRSKDYLELLTGAGLGAGLMYLMDPDHGGQRRDQFRERGQELMGRARPALDRGREALGSAWKSAARTGTSVGHAIAGTTSAISSRIGKYVHSAGETASDVGQSASSMASGLGSGVARGASSAWDTVRGWFGHIPHRQRYTGFMPRSSTGQFLETAGIVTAACACVFLADPVAGRQRRALVRDKFVKTVHDAGDAIDKTARHTWNLLRGVVAEVQGYFSHEQPTDRQIMERVRSRMGRLVEQSRLVEVSVSDGRVFLTGGPIPQSEAEELVDYVRSMRGVNGVENQLGIEPQPTMHGTMESIRGAWRPTTRVASSVVGGALAVYGVQRNDWLGYTLGALGVGLLVRGATNISTRRVARRVARGSHRQRDGGEMLIEVEASNPT